MSRFLIASVATLAVLAVACSGGGSSAPQGSPQGSPPATTGSDCVDESSGAVFDLTQVNKSFQPKCLKVRSSQSIHIVNRDPILHNFSILGTGINVDVQPGGTFNGESPGLEPGTYSFFCKYHRSIGMTGTIVVS